MSNIERLMPTRSEAEDKNRLILDLDEIIPEAYTVRVLGKDFNLIPITGHKLKALDEAHIRVRIVSQKLVMGEAISLDDAIDGYYSFCHLVIPTLSKDDMYQMTTHQVNKLVDLCFKYATNQELKKPETEGDEKKNSLK